MEVSLSLLFVKKSKESFNHYKANRTRRYVSSIVWYVISRLQQLDRHFRIWLHRLTVSTLDRLATNGFNTSRSDLLIQSRVILCLVSLAHWKMQELLHYYLAFNWIIPLSTLHLSTSLQSSLPLQQLVWSELLCLSLILSGYILWSFSPAASFQISRVSSSLLRFASTSRLHMLAFSLSVVFSLCLCSE